MADKDSTLIIEVDLACGTCNVIHQDSEDPVQNPSEGEHQEHLLRHQKLKNEVIISGGFNPHQPYHKQRCKAGCAIKGYKVPEKKKPKGNEKKPKDNDDTKKKGDNGGDKKEIMDGEKTNKVEPKKEEVVAAAPVNTTVNMEFRQVCIFCYPWPCRCRDSSGHSHCQQGGAVAPPAGNNHGPRPPTCGAGPPKCNACAGPSHCGGGGDGWVPPTPLLPWCPGGVLCRGCNGGRVMHEQKLEYPPNSCTAM